MYYTITNKDSVGLGAYSGNILDVIKYVADKTGYDTLFIKRHNSPTKVLPRDFRLDSKVKLMYLEKNFADEILEELCKINDDEEYDISVEPYKDSTSFLEISINLKAIIWTPNLLGPIDTTKAKTLGALLKKGRTLLCKMENGTKVTIFQRPGKNYYEYDTEGEDINVIELLTTTDIEHNRQMWYDITE